MAARNLLLRAVSAVIGLPLVGALIFLREPWPFAVFAFVVAGLALREYAALALRDRPPLERAATIVIGVAFAAAVWWRPYLAHLWMMVAVMLIGAVAVFTARSEDMATAGARLGATGFGVFYVGGLIAALPLLHQESAHGRLWVVCALAVTFIADTGAYFVGKSVGRHKLAPVVSPGKTWEGAFGGLGAGLGFMFVARATFFPALTPLDCALVGLASGVAGPIGDLMESLVKRSAGAKDSGNLIPGHGGMLDRIDAVLFVGAYVYLHVRLLH